MTKKFVICFILHFIKSAEGDYRVLVSTDETMENGQAVLQVYGDKGSTGPVVLTGPPNDGPSFMRGSTDEFKVRMLLLFNTAM